jgi:S-adenosylmethionine:tRNA ribosyltransferase-isomerase
MHSEWCAVSEETVAAVRRTQQLSGRVVAVGTTAVRSLETAAKVGTAESYVGATDLYIRPGYSFSCSGWHVDKLSYAKNDINGTCEHLCWT